MNGRVSLQAQYNVTLTSQTNPDQVLNQILSILPEKNIDFQQKGLERHAASLPFFIILLLLLHSAILPLFSSTIIQVHSQVSDLQ